MEKTPENNSSSSVPLADNNNNHNQVVLIPDGIAQKYFAGSVIQEQIIIIDNLVHDINDQETYLDEFPIGYRFLPTDQELVSAYLLPKINNETLPPNRFHDVDVYNFTPDHLTENYRAQGENGWYFFTPRERKYGNGGRPQRGMKGSGPSGFWKATGTDKPVEIGQKHVGDKKTLVYHIKRGDDVIKQPWSMQEYVAIGKSIPANGKNMTLDDCVLCKIYRKKSNKHNGGNDQAHAQAQCQDQAHVQDQTQDESQQVGYKKCSKKNHSKEPITVSSALMEPENTYNNFNPNGRNKNPYNEQVDYVNKGFEKNGSKGVVIKSSHMNVENGYNNPYPYDWPSIKEETPLPFIGSSFSTYNPSHELNNVGLGQTYNMGNVNCYNNYHVSCTNHVNPSSSTPQLCTTSDLLPNKTENSYANSSYNAIGNDFYHGNSSSVTDQGFLNMMAIDEGDLSIEDYDFVNSCFNDFSGATSPPPDGKVEQLSDQPGESEEVNNDNTRRIG